MERRVIRFDGWSIDFDSGEISKDGVTHRLQDQPLQILEELVKRPGEVVTREQLIARLWPTGVVEFDTGLNSAMRKLRIAIGDDADTPRYIETLPRKGYRFIGSLDDNTPVAGVPNLPAEYVPTIFESGAAIGRRASDKRAPLKRLAWGFGSLLVAGILTVVVWHMPGKLMQVDMPPEKLPTIVVLPLVDMSVEQNEQALCDGLTEELSNWLAHIPSLRVVARTSAFAFKGKNLDVRQIAKELGATHVLEGSLRRSGDQLRITVQLIEAQAGLHMWSRSFDLPIGNIFKIEDTVSRSVAESLHLTLSADTAERWAQRRSGTAEAYEYYLLGRARQLQRTADDNLKSAEFFRMAVAADPQYVPALTGLAETLLNGLSLNHTPLEDVKAEVEPLINRASKINPNLPEVLAVKGWLLTEDFRFDEALPLLERAIKGNPNDAPSHRFLGDFYDRRAQPDEALSHYTAAADLDPMDFISHVFRCVELVDLEDFAAADAACARGRELEPNNLWGPLATAWIARAQGRTVDAITWIDVARKLAPRDEDLVRQKIELLLTQGKAEEARTVALELPVDESFDSSALKSTIVFADGGATALKAWLAERQIIGKAGTGAELAELAELQLMANDAAAARATLAHADRMLPSSSTNLFDGSQIRHVYSAALIRAGIELRGGGDRAKAMKLLGDLDRMLDTYEQAGGTHFGLYVLRAKSLSLQGKQPQAQAALARAWEKGWRASWRTRREPELMGLTVPESK